MYFNSFNNCFILIININIICLIHSSIWKLIYIYNIFITLYLITLYKINFKNHSNKCLFIFNEELLCWLPCSQLMGNEYPLKKNVSLFNLFRICISKNSFSSYAYIIKEVYCPNFALLSIAVWGEHWWVNQ